MGNNVNDTDLVDTCYGCKFNHEGYCPVWKQQVALNTRACIHKEAKQHETSPYK